jgi:calcium/calmodulin-dependent protein kinase I
VDKKNLSAQDEAALRSEVEILNSINCAHVVKCVDFFEEESTFYVVLEFLAGGELFDRIVKKTVYNEAEARDLIRTLLVAIKACHDQHVVHRDLKPENLLLKSKTDDKDVKVADFGFAVVAEDDHCLSTQCGTPGYVAPEILQGTLYGRPVDMWSVGVICYILLGGYPPFYDDNQKMLFRKIKAGSYEFHADYWKGVSADAKDLIKNLLVVKPEKRFTADQALEHAWLKLADTALAGNNLNDQLLELQKFNARRKFRTAVKAVRRPRYFVVPSCCIV